MFDMPVEVKLPLFPLNLVAFPGETVPLHIFEERYKALVQDCMDGGDLPAKRLFGLLQQENQKRSRIGCSMRITEIFHRYADGRLDILCVGEGRFELIEELLGRPYPYAECFNYKDEEEKVPEELEEELETLFKQVISTFKLDPKPEPEVSLDIPLSFRLAKQTVTRAECRQKLLVMRSEITRLRYLKDIFTELVNIVAARDEMKRVIQLNGHFGIVNK